MYNSKRCSKYLEYFFNSAFALLCPELYVANAARISHTSDRNTIIKKYKTLLIENVIKFKIIRTTYKNGINKKETYILYSCPENIICFLFAALNTQWNGIIGNISALTSAPLSQRLNHLHFDGSVRETRWEEIAQKFVFVSVSVFSATRCTKLTTICFFIN